MRLVTRKFIFKQKFMRSLFEECDVRFGSKADIRSAKRHVRFTPESGHVRCNSVCPLCAINVRFASRRTAAKFASLFDEAGGGVRDMTEID
ncbi:MAG: hypothetical protein WCB22_28340, partial [Pseudolabrys sp.]